MRPVVGVDRGLPLSSLMIDLFLLYRNCIGACTESFSLLLLLVSVPALGALGRRWLL